MKNLLLFLFVFALVSCGGNSSSTETASTEEPETETMTEMEEEPMVKDIVALAAETEALSTLVTAVKAAGLVETLQGEGPFTVFAPTNEAFAALPEGTLENLLKPENKDQLIGVLTYHVVPATVMSTDLSNGMKAATVNGAEATVTIGEAGAMIDNAKVISADIEASNGVVHVIDAVILPASE